MLTIGSLMFAFLALLSGVGLGADVASDNGPSWASVVNTALLLVLTYVAHRNGGKADATTDIAKDVQTAVEEAKEFAKSAEECSQAAARISKEVGGLLRATQGGATPSITVAPPSVSEGPGTAPTGTSA